MGILTYVLVAVVVVVALRTVPLIVAWVRLSGTRIRWPGVTLTGREALPEELDPVFQDTEARLSALGFRYHHAQWSEPFPVSDAAKPCRVYHEPETDTYASVYPAVFASPERVADVTFLTAFHDGHTIATVDDIEHKAFAFPPSWETRDHGLDDLEAQWAAHRDAVLARSDRFGTLSFDPETFVLREEQAMAETIAYLAREERATPASEDASLHLRPAAAWRMARALTEGQRRLAAREASRLKREAKGEADDRPTPSEEARLAAQIHAFEYVRDAQSRQGRSPGVDRFLFLLSAALFSLAVGYFFGWRFVPLLVVVILVHELGHLAGMVLFGYRDRRILFIPFVGAAAIGSKENASAFQRLVVLLLGPLPGLAGGVAMLYALGGPQGALLGAGESSLQGWLFDFAVTAVILNYLNLLPVMPLDGGRIVQTLFLGRFPRAQAAFLLGSGLLLGAGGLLAADVVLLALGALTLLAVPWQWRHGSIARQARQGVAREAPRAEKLRAIFSTLEARRGTPTAHRFQIARDVLEHIEAPRARTSTTILGTLLYLGMLLGAPVAAAFALTPDPETLLPATEVGVTTQPAGPAHGTE